MTEKTQKPGAVSKVLGVSGVTLRTYIREFRQFLSATATRDTNRQFTEEDLKVLKVARHLLKEGFTYDEVRQRLPIEGEVFEGEPGPGPEIPGPEIPEPEHAIQPLEFFTAFVDALKEEHQSTIQAKDETISSLKEDKARLQAEVDWLRLPFYVRLFRKPPGRH